MPKRHLPKILLIFTLAAEKAGVAVLLDAEDVIVGDKKSMVTNLQMYHRTLSKMTPSPKAKAQWNAHFK